MSDQTAARNELVDFLAKQDVFSNDTRRQELLQHAGLEFINDIEPNLPKGTYVSTLLNRLKQSGGKAYLQPLFNAVASRSHLEGDPLAKFNQLRDAYLATFEQQPPPPPPPAADLGTLLGKFSDAQLKDLNEHYYPDIQAKFQPGMGRLDQIALLLDFNGRKPDVALANLHEAIGYVRPDLTNTA